MRTSDPNCEKFQNTAGRGTQNKTAQHQSHTSVPASAYITILTLEGVCQVNDEMSVFDCLKN